MAAAYNQSLTRKPREAMPSLTDLLERVERLLLRHDELKRTNALLQEQVLHLSQERDSLRSRLNAARGRIDALLERLPVDNEAGKNPNS
ncbi:FtsZ-binding cell division protein ZapB [Paucibacter oligotrophus]|uniref:FtsZ-binding cell division protein ZapB n=1 Tax=Roseateles oligotrophus TaxID=1769250 RepID=A0A840LE14_9BURK|nr:FtsZ-binding cell division protein ZapB [Roseateles oligotrophus]